MEAELRRQKRAAAIKFQGGVEPALMQCGNFFHSTVTFPMSMKDNPDISLPTMLVRAAQGIVTVKWEKLRTHISAGSTPP